MPKLPKPPKSLPLTPPSYSKPTLPLPSRARRLRLSGEPSSSASSLQPPGSTPKEAWQKVWSERPKISDIQRLPDEALKSAQHQAKLRRWRQWPLYGIGVVAFGMGMYGVMLWISLTRDVDVEALPSDLSDRFDNGAEWYDDKVNFSETLLLLTARRKKLTEMAKGHVLEVAVGTGRNILYYDTKQCATVTLLDSSGPMLTVAKRKWNDTHKEYFNRVFFKQQSALDPIVPPYGAQDGYDTVIQTMGLCSTPEPVKLLQNIEASTNENGQILLLEHGKSYYGWLNNMLDKTAPAHADQHGCWWNKDIGKIVEESGLEVADIKRYNFGTTWWVELRPRKGMRKRIVETPAVEQPPEVQPLTVAQKPWWLRWW